MISIACTNCRTVLTIDDAFAGGVCRCQHCGTIQTVPSHLKATARPTAPEQSTPGSKTLYQRRSSNDAGTGLDELAGAVASSGLGSRRLRTATATATVTKRSPAAAGQKRRSPMLLIVTGAVLLAAVAVFAIVYFMRGSSTAPQAGNNSAPAPVANNNPQPQPTDGGVSKPSGPSFCGVPLIEKNIVYVLDRGSATEQYFDGVKAALYRSLELIGPDHQFAVILTSNGSPDFTFPHKGLADATPDQIQKIRSAMDDVIATGASQLRPALEKAVARHPDVIVVVTAKWTIDSDDTAALKQYAQRGIRIHTFMLGSSDAVDALQQAASLSGGIFSRVSDSQLRDFGS
jgi:hypothetical protein